MPGIRGFTRGRRTWVFRSNSWWQCVWGAAGRWSLGAGEALAEKAKASVRAKVEHPFLKVKRLFGYAKVRYRGLAKNMGADWRCCSGWVIC